MTRPGNHRIDRRTLLKTGAAAGLLAFAPGIQLISAAPARAAAKLVIQYDWLMSNGQIGDIAAMKNGYFEEAGFEVTFSPGGPNSATVPPVISGAAQLGQFSETPQLFAARASGVPVRIIACGFRTGAPAPTR